MNSRRAHFTLTAISILALAAPALADWPAGGKVVIQVLQSSRGIYGAEITETPSGDLMLFGVGKGGNGSGMSVMRITRDGEIAPGWGLPGVDLGITPFGRRLVGCAADDSSGFWAARYVSPETRVIHVSPSGQPEPNPYGWNVGSSSLAYAAATTPDGSDFYFATAPGTIRRFTRAGTVAPGWPAGGRAAFGSVSSFLPELTLLPDGSGGAVLYCKTDVGPLAARVDANSSLHAGWPAGGLALGSAPSRYTYPDWPSRSLVPSGPDHFLAMWVDYPNGDLPPARVKMQRFSLDGSLDPGWPVAGLPVASPDTIANVTLISDGLDGAYVLWERSGRPRGTHVLANGTFANGYSTDGVPLLPDDAGYVPVTQGYLPGTPGYYGATTDLPYLVADHGTGGGLVFVSCEPGTASTNVLRARWLLPDLTPDPATPDTGVTVVTFTDPHYPAHQRAALADGEGGIFLAWESGGGSPSSAHECAMAMTRVSRPVVTGVPPANASTSFALGGAAPNPVRGSVTLRCTLPGEGAARLELFDVSGRRWRSATVSGAGEHVMRFDDLGSLPAGLYLARLALGAESRTTRFVKMR